MFSHSPPYRLALRQSRCPVFSQHLPYFLYVLDFHLLSFCLHSCMDYPHKLFNHFIIPLWHQIIPSNERSLATVYRLRPAFQLHLRWLFSQHPTFDFRLAHTFTTFVLAQPSLSLYPLLSFLQQTPSFQHLTSSILHSLHSGRPYLTTVFQHLQIRHFTGSTRFDSFQRLYCDRLHYPLFRPPWRNLAASLSNHIITLPRVTVHTRTPFFFFFFMHHFLSFWGTIITLFWVLRNPLFCLSGTMQPVVRFNWALGLCPLFFFPYWSNMRLMSSLPECCVTPVTLFKFVYFSPFSLLEDNVQLMSSMPECYITYIIFLAWVLGPFFLFIGALCHPRPLYLGVRNSG
jgi:hypothetical protein